MINIVLKGIDIYLAGDFEKKLIAPLAKVMKVHEREIVLSALESLVYHNGVEQTSMHLYIDVECDKKYAQYEKEVADLILGLSKQFAIHTHVLFKYYETIHLHEEIDHQYPLYLDEGNIANVEQTQEDIENGNIDIFDGNIFKDYEDVFPNITDEEKKN